MSDLVARSGVLPMSGMVFIHAGDATSGHGPTGRGLSCCRPQTKSAAGESGVAIRQKSFPTAASTQQRTLKMELKCRRWTLAIGKDLPQMFHGLQQRVGLPTRWR